MSSTAIDTLTEVRDRLQAAADMEPPADVTHPHSWRLGVLEGAISHALITLKHRAFPQVERLAAEPVPGPDAETVRFDAEPEPEPEPIPFGRCHEFELGDTVRVTGNGDRRNAVRHHHPVGAVGTVQTVEYDGTVYVSVDGLWQHVHPSHLEHVGAAEAGR